MLAKPIKAEVSAWQNLETGKDFSQISGSNYYKAKIGARTEPYSIFWLKIIDLTSDNNLLVKNITEGRRGKKIEKVESRIENSLIFPSFRGADVNRWSYQSEIYTLILNDPNNPTKPFPEGYIKNTFPLTYSYLVKFKSELDTTSFFATNSEPEAHYLSAIINSKPVRDFIKSFSSAGRGFGTPSVMEHIGIPKFDPKNPLHQKLSEISKNCHKLKLEGKEEEIKKLEEKNDELVWRLFTKEE